MFNQARAALNVGFQGFQQFFPVRIGGFPLQHLDRDQQRRQDVVEIVADAARQCPDVFHALRAQELGFKLFPLRDIVGDAQDGLGGSPIVAQQGPARFHNHFLSALCPGGELALPVARFQNDFFGLFKFQSVEHVLGQKVLLLPSHRFLDGPAVNPLGTLIPIQNAVFHIPHEDGVVGQLQHPGLFPDLRLGFFALDDFQLQIFNGPGQMHRLVRDHHFQSVPYPFSLLFRPQSFFEHGFDVDHAGEQQ